MSTGGAEIAGEVRTILGVDDTEAREKFARIDALMGKVAAAAKDLDAQIKAGKYAPGPELDAATAKLDHLQDVMAGLKASQDRLASSTTTVNTAMASVNSNAGRVGQTILQLGYIADDAQYGFSGIANNLPMLFAGLGPMAMGVVAVTATATNQVIKHWDDITGAFSDTTAFKSTTEVIKELEATVRRTVEEFIRLKEARAAAEKTERGESAARSLPKGTPEDAARGEAFGKAVGAASGLPAVTDAYLKANPDYLLRNRNAEDSRKVSERQAEVDDIRHQIEVEKGLTGKADVNDEFKAVLADRVSRLRAAEMEADENARKWLESRIGLIKDSGKKEEIEKFVGELPGAMRGKFAEVPAAPDVKAKKESDAKTVREADEEAARVDAEDAENLKKFRDARQEIRRKALERAQALSKGEMGQQAIAGTLQRRDVADALVKSGVDPAVAERRAGDVHQAMKDIAAKQIRERSLARDMTPDEAAVSLMQEDEDRKKKEADRKADEARKEALGRAREAVPGIDEFVKGGLLHTPGDFGRADEAARAAVTGRLRGAGLGDEEAGRAAAELVRGARRGLTEMVEKLKAGDPAALAEALGGGGEGPKRSSQTMDPLSLVHAIQAGVGGDTGKEQVRKLTRLVEIQNQMLNLQRNRRPGVFLPNN